MWLYDEATGLLTQKMYADWHGVFIILRVSQSDEDVGRSKVENHVLFCYNYSDDGKLTTRIWARGVTTTYSYDGWNQLTNTVYSDGTPSVTLAYDAMGRQTSATDAAGTTTFAYTPYGEPLSETWGGLGNRVLLRHYDAYGRSVGCSAKGVRKTTLSYDAATGRLATMNEGGNFTWNYLPGSDLKSRVVYPNGVTVDYTYEPNRDLLTNVKNYRGDTTYSEYSYSNDALGRRTAKNAETYGYNDRNELTSASTGYLYAYDDIGNRLTAAEPEDSKEYTANALNQYSIISNLCVSVPLWEAFTPTYDLDGNQTLVKTSTGVWAVEYNGENRPIRWSRTNDNTVVTMDFDRMGRRTFYKEMKGNTQVTFTRFFYDGYLMIQQLFSNSPYNIYKEFIWDPTEPVATKPLCFRQNGKTATFYTHDGNKNVSDVISVSPYNQRTAHYEYAPFGAITSAVGWRTTDNPYRFSSEFHDDTLGLVYYNYRHYNPKDGRWTSRDPSGEENSLGLYGVVINNLTDEFDYLGMVDLTEFVRKYVNASGGYDISRALLPNNGIPVPFIPGAPRFQIHIFASAEKRYCCSNDHQETFINGTVALEAYLVWGHGEKRPFKGRDRNNRDPERPGVKIKRNEYHVPDSGYRSRDWHFGGNVEALPVCPDKGLKWGAFTGAIYFRGSAGVGFIGVQGNVQINISANMDVEHMFSASFGLARRVYGVTFEAGGGGYGSFTYR